MESTHLSIHYPSTRQLYRVYLIDILSERVQMLFAVLLLNSACLAVLFMDGFAKWYARTELTATGSPLLVIKVRLTSLPQINSISLPIHLPTHRQQMKTTYRSSPQWPS